MMRNKVLTAAALAFLILLVAAPRAVAEPQGELVVESVRNEPVGGNCGIYTVNMYNASDTPILKVRLLIYVWVGGEGSNDRPYQGTKARSWVTFKTFIKPGKAVQGSSRLCATVPLASNAVDFASFKWRKAQWTWTK